ncbi:probable WRKY transcription factor 32 isoform X2 [Mercurialis annua]|uniref:probable WRKY transcription factor 32 isoform X2 n=1 Tax=Mercurialis annua TaxID=3986 RepID=UPI00215E07EF|nr:probable WRKY transcription factor 32 isoform X2 [Mercurialis annua]
MADSESLEAIHVRQLQKRQVGEENDVALLDEEELESDDEETDEVEGSQLDQFAELHQQQLSSTQVDDELWGPQLGGLPAVPLPENDQRVGLKNKNKNNINNYSASETHVIDAQLKDKDKGSQPEDLGSVRTQGAEAQTQNKLQSSICPTSSSELSPTSVTQPISSAPSPTLPEPRLTPPKVSNNACTPKAVKSICLPVVRVHMPDGYNWRKYGQKQVKSPEGSRSYYKCTYSDCCAKKIECTDNSGHMIEIVNKGAHSHDPPRKSNCTRESKVALLSTPVLDDSITEQSTGMLTDSNQTTLSKESLQEMPAIPDKKRQNSSGSDENGKFLIKEEHASEREPKRRVKKESLECSGTSLKPGKKPKFVVHAAGDVGISGDGYRWRKYGQKMVKGNPHPRNYYRCTSAGCPVRKHIETAVDNTSAVIITYKGVHDHDTPVPKKRHGPTSAPLVAAASPASMNNLQLKKIDTLPNQVSSTQWSVGKEGELTSEKLDGGVEKEKAIESARTLLSIGFEIKPC